MVGPADLANCNVASSTGPAEGALTGSLGGVTGDANGGGMSGAAGGKNDSAANGGGGVGIGTLVQFTPPGWTPKPLASSRLPVSNWLIPAPKRGFLRAMSFPYLADRL